MRYILSILLLLPVVAFAGSQTHNPNADITQGVDWSGCDSATFYACVKDEVDAQDLSHYDNNNLTRVSFECEDNPGSIPSDSTIDSVTIYAKWQTDNVSNTWAFWDSTEGNTRTSSTISTGSVGVWITDSVTYTTASDGENAWEWETLIPGLAIGFQTVAKGNNKTIRVTKMWFTVWWTSAGGAGAQYVRRRMIIMGE